jgi:hypothetical protein
MTLRDNPAAIVLALALGLTSMVVFDVFTTDTLTNLVIPYAPYVFMGALGGAYMISERAMGDLDNMELGAFVIGLGAFLGIEFVPAVSDFVASYQPYSGIILTIVVMGAFYVLTLED